VIVLNSILNFISREMINMFVFDASPSSVTPHPQPGENCRKIRSGTRVSATQMRVTWQCWIFVMVLGGSSMAVEPPGAGVVGGLVAQDMEQLATPEQVAAFTERVKRGCYVFGEDRVNSIRRHDALPAHWLDDRNARLEQFSGVAQPGEFYVFQLAVYAPDQELGPLALRCTALKAGGLTIPEAAIRCFNQGGTDFMGRSFRKELRVAKGRVQPLWIGVQIPRQASGRFQGNIVLSAPGVAPVDVRLQLSVAGEWLEDCGDAQSWRLSRLRWLDSSIAQSDTVVVKPFVPLRRKGNALFLLGRRLTLADGGLPSGVASYFNASNTRIGDKAVEVLAQPLQLIVETEVGAVKFDTGKVKFLREKPCVIEWTAANDSPALGLEVGGLVEFDGFVQLRCALVAKQAVAIQDVRLEGAFTRAASTYFMGLNRRGGVRPEIVEWKWDPNTQQDGFWIGAVNAGLKLQLKGGNFRSPLINAYYGQRKLNMPDSWCNGGLGGVVLTNQPDTRVKLAAASGKRQMQAGERLQFDFDLFLTPFKPLDTENQWKLRYFHPHQGVEDPDLADPARIAAMGANVVNIHHNKLPNPCINYPYLDMSFPRLIECVKKAHAAGLLAKLYYTTREISNNLPELFAFHSLNGEVICPPREGQAKPITNSNGAHPWLVEHLREDFIPAWRETLGGPYNGMLDLAVITTPDSRLDNFYLEGLAYTAAKADIDGLYIDDTSMGRKTSQRARRILDARHPNSQIDSHSWSHFNWDAGMMPSAYCYMQNFPYYNRLWYGEGFGYDARPDLWLVEMSGIPFGLMSEMLGVGQPWRGMVFGEVARLGWGGEPRPLWKAMDEFGMAGTEMIGFWDAACPVKTGNPEVLATVYRKKGSALISLASWSAKDESVRLVIDFKALGIDSANATLTAMPMDKLQPMAVYPISEAITISSNKGLLLTLKP
jgi:hypothetical protein